ncbi:precorrin-3B C(17)-methyltransferase [Haloparvum sp. AD34]
MTGKTGVPGDATDADDGMGTLYVVGIGPGLPHAMTQRARDVIRYADCVIASNLYQEFLRQDGTIPPESRTESIDQEAASDGGVAAAAAADDVDEWEPGKLGTHPDGDQVEIVRSSMGQQVELAREAFARVRAGQDVVHVSGGDANVYGKSDLVYLMAEEEEAYDIPIEIVPGVTAALGGAAMVGAPLSNDFCTISLSDKWRGWEEIEEKLQAAAVSGFVVVLYNCWRDYERAIEVLREHRTDDAPVAIVNDAGRGEAGRNLEDETYTLTTLGEATEHDDKVSGMGTSLIVGNHETETWENDHGEFLVTPRGGRDVDDF